MPFATLSTIVWCIYRQRGGDLCTKKGWVRRLQPSQDSVATTPGPVPPGVREPYWTMEALPNSAAPRLTYLRKNA